MSIAELLRSKIEKQLAAMDQKLEAAEAEARARHAQAEADMADAELEHELLTQVNDLKDRIAEGHAYLKELVDAGDEKAEQVKKRLASFFD